ncbi:MAG: Hpt domain-containing protein [Erysipelotrichaceae bacterium]|nr:Hpt domain-containing protein [Erysipelotrichaceae bacterium]
MLTIEELKKLGCDTDEGLARCVNQEDFYLRLVNNAINCEDFNILKEALENKDLDAAFETAHKLKGALGNLSLTPLYDKAVEITELLRNRTNTDYSELLEELLKLKEEYKALCDE